MESPKISPPRSPKISRDAQAYIVLLANLMTSLSIAALDKVPSQISLDGGGAVWWPSWFSSTETTIGYIDVI